MYEQAVSSAQRRLWFLAQLGQDASRAYHLPQAWLVDGPLDHAALRRALDALVARHEALRTRFVVSAGEPVAVVDPPEVGFALRVEDLGGRDPEVVRRAEATAPFDLERGPVARGLLLVLGPDRHVVVVTMHHLVSDGWSMGVFARELGALYAGAELPPPPDGMPPRRVPGRAAVDYWAATLRGAPPLLELPTDRARPDRQDHNGAWVPLELDAALTADVTALARRHGVTAFMTLLTAWTVVLSRLSGQPDLVVGTPVVNRDRAELEGVIGLVADTVALRVDLADAPSTAALLARVRGVVLGALAHQELPFEQVVELVNPVRSADRTPVFQTMFSWQNLDQPPPSLPGAEVTALAPPRLTSQFDLTLAIGPGAAGRPADPSGCLSGGTPGGVPGGVSGGLSGGIEYATALFDEATVRHVAELFRRTLAAMVAGPDTPVTALPLTTADERRDLLAGATCPVVPSAGAVGDGPGRPGDGPPTGFAHEWVQRWAARDPRARAVTCDGRTLHYGVLNRRANRLAHHLRALGVGQDTVVALCLERSTDAVVALLAVLKAGGAYLPLDPAHPAERLARMVRDTAPALIVTHAATRSVCPRSVEAVEVVDLDADAYRWRDLPSLDPAPDGLAPAHLAYVIHTSGSTGTPKGVAVEHRQLAAVAAAWGPALGLRPGLAHLQTAGFSFDVFTADVVRALAFGGELVLCPRGLLLDPPALAEFVRRHRIGFADIVPAVLEPLMAHLEATGSRLAGLETVVCGSDVWTAAQAERLRALCGPDTRIVNAYGVTEAAVDSTHHVLAPDGPAPARLPMGRPLPGVRTYLLDPAGEPVPVGVAGELHLGGDGVARGYLGRPAFTAERFVANPFVPGERLYRTGDRARLRPDGTLEFLGRVDSQVKVRGHRVEPGEVRAHLLAVPGVRDAVVLADPDPAGGTRLLAYYLPTAHPAGADAIEPAAVRERLVAVLPEHLVPAACVRLDAWPLTPNGKLDRAALPRPAQDGGGWTPPVGELETALAAVWERVLGVPRVGRHDHFFAMGGHSLLAMKLVSAVRQELGREVSPTAVFSAPTLAAFADAMARLPDGSVGTGDSAAEVLPPIRPVTDHGPLAPSFAQQRLWFLAQLGGGAAEAYHMPLALRLDGPLDRAAVARALDALVARHEALRTRFTAVAGEPVAHVDPPDIGFALRVEDLGGRDPEVVRREEAAAPFDLERGPVARGRLVVLAPDRHLLLVTVHHIVSDGWSMGVFARELGALYAGHEPAPLPVRYADYAAWQRDWLAAGAGAEQAAYWAEALAGAPPLLELPTDRPRPARQDHRGARVPVVIDAELTAAVADLARRHEVTVFMTLLAAWTVVLSRLSGQSDVVVGAPTANRRRAELDGLIGLFVNTLALRVDLTGAPTGVELLERVRGVVLAAQEHQDVPFEHVVELVNPSRGLGHAPLFQAMLAWQHTEDGGPSLPGVEVTALPTTYAVARFDLTLSLGERDGRVVGGLEYATALFDADTAERHVRHLRRVLEELTRDPTVPVAAVDLLDERQRHQVLRDWSRPDHPATGPGTRALFLAQAARTPDAVAVIGQDATLTYAELDARANRLAWHLRGRGVGPDDRVALCLDRRTDLVVAMAAILRAGAAVVPLDPGHPAGRLALLVRDTTPALLLTRAAVRPAGLPQDLPVLCTDTPTWGDEPATDPGVVCAPDQLAYVIHTSGSTGHPKGVAQTWRTLDAVVHWHLRHGDSADSAARVLQFASVGFDVSVQEVWTTLCHGATLVLLDDDRRRDLAALRAFMADNGVTRAFLPATVLRHLAAATPPPGTAARDARPVACEIVTAGEALRVDDSLRALVTALGGSHLRNQYGPTETHVASEHALAVADARHWPALPPIGRPVAHARLFVLDALLRPVPVGVVGELYIGGDSLARGYLGRPALTAERFVADPHGEPGARVYRSGDLVRWRADGTLDFVGRADDQVKVRGVRVEPGEVEGVLRGLPGVRDAAVLLRGDTLAAYLVGDATPDEAREALRRLLPEHLVPTAWGRVQRLPLTVNGKLDRRALPEPQGPAGAEYVPPRTAREALLAQVWAEVLRRDRVGVTDDFFALGGHSLLATRLVHAVNRSMGARLSLRTLFEHPVLGELAQRLDTEGDAASAYVFPPLVPDPDGRTEPFPLTDIQQAYWVGRDSTFELGGVAAHGYREIRVPHLDSERFTAALNRLVARHDMLRVVFHSDGTQQVLGTVPPYRMPRHDLRGLDPDTARARLGELRERLSHQVLDAGRWPLFEFAITLLDDETRLHISTDALVVDVASSQILERELMRLYADPDAELAPLELSFRDYVLAELALRDTPRYRRALAYWRERLPSLAGGPALPLHRRPETVLRPRFTRYDHRLPADTWSALKATAGRHNLTPTVLLLTAFAQVLALWSRHPRFTLSLPLFNRLPLHPAINAVIGDFTSSVLLEVEVTAGAGFVAQARAVQERLWRDIDHSAVSGVRVLRELTQLRGVNQSAMPIVFNSTLSELDPDADDRGLAHALGGESVHTITQTPQVWIDHTVMEAGGALLFNWDSIDELFPRGLVAEMFAAYLALLDRLTDPEAWQAPLEDLLPAARMAPPPPAPDGPFPLLHELVDRRALATPTATAVLAPDRRLDFATLRREARWLAGRLQARGVGRGDLVAVMMDRGWEQVVATLAVLYAGGAYLPIEVDLPAGRVAHLLDRAGSSLVLVRPGDVTPVLPDGVVALPVDAITCGPGSADPKPVGLTDTDLAYVIYTSGSTGTPKGVVVDHRGAVNTLLDVNERFAVGPTDRVLAISSLSFDLSVYDIFGTLAAGAAVVIPEPAQARDPAHWLELVDTHRVSVWNSVPALLGLLVEHAEVGGRLPDSLRLAMLSGDWIPVTLPDRLRRLLPAVRVHSLGGATEASIWSIHHPIGEVDPAWRSIPYGRALAHQRFHVLDDAMRPRPTWVPGHLFIGGIGLAQGYWRDEATTAAAFVTHPVTGERLYRTGDLGRLLPDGTIEFLGREDGQVKVHGYRVELGEIEATLQAHPAVESAVLRLIGDTHGDKRLAAYVVLREAVPVAALAEHLAHTLPAYMVPGSVTVLDALPLSANGKVDRSRLPDPVDDEPAGEEPVAADAAEARLLAIVEEVLGRTGIAARANLLHLGATSIDIVRISNALSAELGFRPRLAHFMRRPTPADLLALYRDHTAAAPAAAAPAGGVVEDPVGRKDFTAARPGLRVLAAAPTVPLPAPTNGHHAQYRSVRRFDDRPVEATALAGLLACLARAELDGRPKYQYGSAGGCYAVQTYLYVKPGRVSGVPGGAHYYDPDRHTLVRVGDGRSFDGDAYDYFVNRPVFDAGAFALFLVAELTAIEPLYGEQALGFCHIEAGAMSQLLTMTAPALGLGVCGIGSVDRALLDPLLALGPSHRLVYSLVGGVPAAPAGTGPAVTEPGPAGVGEAVELEDIEI
jgi:amino acid adenylation domain-containing protein